MRPDEGRDRPTSSGGIEQGSGPLYNIRYDRVSAAQHYKDRLALKDLNIAEAYVRGDIKIWLPYIVEDETGVGLPDRNGYAVFEAAVSVDNKPNGVRPDGSAAASGVNALYTGQSSSGGHWYNFDMTVVVGKPPEIPEEFVAVPSRIGFFVGDEVRELRANERLKSLSAGPILIEDFAKVLTVAGKREADVSGVFAAVAPGSDDSEMFERGSKIVQRVADETCDQIARHGPAERELEMFVSRLRIHLFDNRAGIALEEGIECPFSFRDILVGPL